MPNLVRLYVTSIVVGFVLAVLFTALLLMLDIAGLRHLVLGSAAGRLGGLMLVAFNTIVFSGAQFGIAVMHLADSQLPPGGLRQFDGSSAGLDAGSGRLPAIMVVQ